ncbi:hypothetical protein AVEN_177344-1 [Araneus ventricosus]|uniref:Uncharacterized protein n=1 Tax=Araneus ventricosus TaxID=182803 RepID=A0A4Y2QH24_ARAVE|nr:hypothetical protein AVEN_177344-1 [Araneus ventricosus]
MFLMLSYYNNVIRINPGLDVSPRNTVSINRSNVAGRYKGPERHCAKLPGPCPLVKNFSSIFRLDQAPEYPRCDRSMSRNHCGFPFKTSRFSSIQVVEDNYRYHVSFNFPT